MDADSSFGFHSYYNMLDFHGPPAPPPPPPQNPTSSYTSSFQPDLMNLGPYLNLHEDLGDEMGSNQHLKGYSHDPLVFIPSQQTKPVFKKADINPRMLMPKGVDKDKRPKPTVQTPSEGLAPLSSIFKSIETLKTKEREATRHEKNEKKQAKVVSPESVVPTPSPTPISGFEKPYMATVVSFPNFGGYLTQEPKKSKKRTLTGAKTSGDKPVSSSDDTEERSSHPSLSVGSHGKESDYLNRAVVVANQKHILHQYYHQFEARIHYLASAFFWTPQYTVKFRETCFRFLPKETNPDFYSRMSVLTKHNLMSASYYHLALFMATYCCGGKALTPYDFNVVFSDADKETSKHVEFSKFYEEKDPTERDDMNLQWKFMHTCFPSMFGTFTSLLQAQMCMHLIDQMRDRGAWDSLKEPKMWDMQMLAHPDPAMVTRTVTELPAYYRLFKDAKALVVALYRKDWFQPVVPLVSIASDDSSKKIPRHDLHQRSFRLNLVPIWNTTMVVVFWLAMKRCVDPRFSSPEKAHMSDLCKNFEKNYMADRVKHYFWFLSKSSYNILKTRLYSVLKNMVEKRELDLAEDLENRYVPVSQDERDTWTSYYGPSVPPSVLSYFDAPVKAKASTSSSSSPLHRSQSTPVKPLKASIPLLQPVESAPQEKKIKLEVAKGPPHQVVQESAKKVKIEPPEGTSDLLKHLEWF